MTIQSPLVTVYKKSKREDGRRRGLAHTLTLQQSVCTHRIGASCGVSFSRSARHGCPAHTLVYAQPCIHAKALFVFFLYLVWLKGGAVLCYFGVVSHYFWNNSSTKYSRENRESYPPIFFFLHLGGVLTNNTPRPDLKSKLIWGRLSGQVFKKEKERERERERVKRYDLNAFLKGGEVGKNTLWGERKALYVQILKHLHNIVVVAEKREDFESVGTLKSSLKRGRFFVVSTIYLLV